MASCSLDCNSLAKAKLFANCCRSRRASRSVTWVATIVLAEKTSCRTDCKILNSGLECLVEAIRRTMDSAACLRRLRMPFKAALSSRRVCSCSRVNMVVLPDLRMLTSELNAFCDFLGRLTFGILKCTLERFRSWNLSGSFY